MRRILVDVARMRGARKRGGQMARVPLEDGVDVAIERGDDLVALDDALGALATVDPRKGRVVELRYFGGLTVEETAEVPKVSVETVMRDWKLARLWLHRELHRGPEP
jgi:RNA polymerase sigma factor (TIGR02999 family)